MDDLDCAGSIIKTYKEKLNGNNISTKIVRQVSSKEFAKLKNKKIEAVLKECESLLETADWAMSVIAYDWAFRMKDQYTKKTFHIFENWLANSVKGWGDCDDFCTHAFGALIGKYNYLFKNVLKWTHSDKFTMRRASAVILIYPIHKQQLGLINPYKVSNSLMNDKEPLVLKGYGWMLKELSVLRKNEVVEYLRNNKEKMPKISLRYAMERMEKKEKELILDT